MNLKEIQHIYFLGIGGMGMSALAWYFHEQGKHVSGYDLNESPVTTALAESGIPVFHAPDPLHLKGQECIIYTPAIPQEHPELLAVKSLELPLYKRAEILGMLSKSYKTLAVAGTHGKTTTSAMLTHLMRSSGVSTTAFLGGISHNLGSNYVKGDSPYAIMEADEYDRSFLQLHPTLSLITALEADHLDIYGTQEELEKAYFQFAQKTDNTQPLLIHESLVEYDWEKTCISYGVEKGDFQAQNVTHKGISVQFDFVGKGISLSDIHLPMPGIHNVSNMVGALALGYLLGIDPGSMKEAVGSFSGIHRRFDVQFDGKDITYVDDYAHHPTEVLAAVKTAQTLFPARKTIVVFQPHLYSRTQDQAKGFSQVLNTVDQVLLLDIYPAREEPIAGVSSQMILNNITQAEAACIKREELIPTLSKWVQSPSVILSLGAGDIDKEVQHIKKWCQVHPIS